MNRHKPWDWSQVIDRARGRLETHQSGKWRSGTVATPEGYVEVYSEPGTVTLRFIWKGREYVRTVKERDMLTGRGAAIRAWRFARETATAVVAGVR